MKQSPLVRKPIVMTPKTNSEATREPIATKKGVKNASRHPPPDC